MRIGLTGGAGTVDRMIDQAVEAEAEGFTSLWYASAIGGDPLVAMALAGRATERIELGTAVLQTYTCHPVLQANRAAAVAAAMGRPGFTLGVGPSHRPAIEDAYGLSYATPGRHTEEYVTVLTRLLAGESVDHHGEELTVRAEARAPLAAPVSVMVSALAPRLLRVAGELTDGTILWMAPARAVAEHVVPRITRAAEAAGRGAPRVVAGLPVAVHDDEAEARATAGRVFAGYGELPNYRRILDLGGAGGPADAAIVGDEATVTRGIEALFDAGATDVWAAVFPVGDDRAGSRARTRALLRELAAA
ncbi:MAG TPA: TIGR03564 family F420-dependent LLM class oxidoreductase [Acidimicrobiales bacterium]|nr:TIGR03564 family F420-dependent LLM class oxidoreductase [Acidimicrobiales bacterium]